MIKPDHREAILDAAHLIEHNREVIREFHRVGLSRGQARPLVFVLDLRCELARRILDEHRGSPGMGESVREEMQQFAPDDIPTIFVPFDRSRIMGFLDQILTPEGAEVVIAREADPDEIIAVVITHDRPGVKVVA